MTKVELVFIPSPGLSHLVSTVQAAKLLLDRDHHLAITILIVKFPKERNQSSDEYADKLSSLTKNIKTGLLRFIDLPDDHNLPAQSKTFLFDYINTRIDRIRHIVSDLSKQPDSCLAGLILDMFCTKFMVVAEEFSIPSYVFSFCI